MIAVLVFSLSTSTAALAQSSGGTRPLSCMQTAEGDQYGCTGGSSDGVSGGGDGGSSDGGTNCRLVQVVTTTAGNWSVWPPSFGSSTTVTNTYQCGP